MTVDEMIKDILEKEGGYVNHIADKGGPTNFGVTQATYAAYLGHAVTIDNVKNMKREEAYEIYKDQYFKRPRLDMLPPAVQPIIFDIAVNSGPKKAVKMLQEVLDRLGYKIGVVDGAMGPNTAAQAERAYAVMGDDFIKQMVNRRLSFYRSIVKNDPSQKVFLAGWENRANSFLA